MIMGANKEILVDLQEKYEKVRKLVDQSSLNDPVHRPHISKIAACQHLTTMKNQLINLIDNPTTVDSDKYRFRVMLSVVLMNLGVISIEIDALATGEEHFTTCLQHCQGEELNPDYVTIVLKILNQLGILYSTLDNIKRSQEYLERAEKIYDDFKDKRIAPNNPSDFFKASDDIVETDAVLDFEKTHTLSLYYLAQVYGNLNEYTKSGVYCHNTLKRQLESKDFEHVDWALNSATLSQFFLKNYNFTKARHHLAAALYMLDRFEEELQQTEASEEELAAKRERLVSKRADVFRCCAKYGMILMSASKDRLMVNSDDEQTTANLAKMKITEQEEENDVPLRFSLELSVYEDQITDKFLLDYDEAKTVFHTVLNWLNAAKEYFTIDTHASDRADIAQDYSHLYQGLSFFEEDEERMCKLLKRRANNLEEVVQVLNPQYFLVVCRQFWFELGEIYSDMLEIKLDKLKASQAVPTAHALKKINLLAEKGIENFNRFIDSLRDKVTQELPATVSAEMAKPMLIAYFHIGRLYGKIITPDKRMQLHYTKLSMEAYRNCVDYVNGNKNCEEQVKSELEICRSLAELLPLKIQKLQAIVGDLEQ